MRKIIVGFLALTVLFSSCGTGDGDSMSKSDRLAIIKELEDKAFSDVNKFDTTSALALVKNYSQFCDENKEDELSPAYLFKAGDLSMALRKSTMAIDFFNRIVNDYPDFEKVAYSMFLVAFIYDDQLKDYDAAKKSYNAFIEKYPDHEMTDAARFSIKNLGKSPEELIREFEKKSDTTEVQI